MSEDMVCQIYETFLYNQITDVSVMQPKVLDHYEVMESDRLEQLKTIFKEMDSKKEIFKRRIMLAEIKENV